MGSEARILGWDVRNHKTSQLDPLMGRLTETLAGKDTALLSCPSLHSQLNMSLVEQAIDGLLCLNRMGRFLLQSLMANPI